MPIDEQVRAQENLHLLLNRHDSDSIRSAIMNEARGAHSADQVLTHCLQFVQEEMENSYLDLPVAPIDLVDGPLYPQLLGYLIDPGGRRLFIRKAGSPTIDEGGPSREALVQMRTQIPDIYADHVLELDERGEYIIRAEGVDPDLAHAFGQQLYLMVTLGVPLPDGVLIDKEEFNAMALYSPEMLAETSLRDVLHSCGDDLPLLQDLYRHVNAYELGKTPEFTPDCLRTNEEIIESVRADHPDLPEEELAPLIQHEIAEAIEELKQGILTRETRFAVAKALSQNGHFPIRPIYSQMLTESPDLRARLQNADSWDFSNLSGDAELQAEYFLRWAGEAEP